MVELGCGDGTLLAALAGAGWRVIGVDVSPAMLALAGFDVRVGRAWGELEAGPGRRVFDATRR